MNDYTFEQYNDARETREWLVRFLREHNGDDWERKQTFPIEDLLTGNLPQAPNGETTRVFWYRIRYKGTLIGYADTKVHPTFNGRAIISDMWMFPEFRGRGHFHRSFAQLVEYTKAIGVCIVMQKYQLYAGWFKLFGFDWLSAFDVGPSDQPEAAVVFLTTRDAYKDFIRYILKQTDSVGYPGTQRGRVVFDEVLRELEKSGT